MSYSTRTLAFLMVVGSMLSIPRPIADQPRSTISDQPLLVAMSVDASFRAMSEAAMSPLVAIEPESMDAPKVTGGDKEARASVEWAVGLFAAVDLELPPFTMAIHADDGPCGGYAGVARLAEVPLHIDVCNSHRLIIVHELAHAWDHVTLTDAEREAYMETRGLQSWNDASVEWKDRGIEDLAQVLVWGLLRIDRAQPVDPSDGRGNAFSFATGIDLSAVEATESEERPNLAAEPEVRPDDWDDVN
ncbi:hypothetical protein ACFLQ7_02125 [Actinomycetota bacterium]